MRMKIDEYTFGKIVIDGLVYRSDVLLLPDRIDDKWWRKDGHLLRAGDLGELWLSKPAVLIVGQGLPGMMRVDPGLMEYCSKNGIEILIMPTADAVNQYNEMADKRPLLTAALHLTC